MIIAPEVNADALPLLAAKKNVRVLACGSWPQEPAATLDFKRVNGGLLVQEADLALLRIETQGGYRTCAQ